MQKIKNILKMILYFTVGFLVFSGIVALVEIIFLNVLSDTVPTYIELFIKAVPRSAKVYCIVSIVVFVLNVLCNLISIKVLNDKLNKVKREG
ncbi:MAG: hypothetical protein IJX99_04890, partial [Clostridia bacterium]|nr:hypothetical protein [Clostridia bacterium]